MVVNDKLTWTDILQMEIVGDSTTYCSKFLVSYMELNMDCILLNMYTSEIP
jgi:hypothetical protein